MYPVKKLTNNTEKRANDFKVERISNKMVHNFISRIESNDIFVISSLGRHYVLLDVISKEQICVLCFESTRNGWC